MRAQMALTKQVKRFLFGVDNLIERSHVLEGLGMVSGPAGTGKTTTIAYARNQFNAVAVECSVAWNAKTMLEDIAHEMGLPTGNTVHGFRRDIIARMRQTGRPLFLDEADKILPRRTPDWKRPAVVKKVEILREIYNNTRVPIVFIGEELSARILDAEEHFQRRITQRVEFGGIDLEDARTVADTVCEVTVDDDLLAHLHRSASGVVDRIVRGLDQVEKFARTNRLASVGLSAWGDAPFDFNTGKPALVR